ncbi:MAG: 4-vinyl reductase [Candidatus Nezhaarchaeales archaeon]
MLGGERAIIVRKPGYKGFIDDVRKQFKSAGEAFLYYEGYNAGIEYGKAHRKLAEKLGIRDPIQIIYKVLAPLFTSTGFGRLEVVRVNLNPPEVTIRIYNNFECEEGIGAGKPYSQWVRGSIAGIFTSILNIEVKAIETKCIAKGDPYCEFEIIK